MKDDGLTISDMAEQSRLSSHTLRYYEKIGLLEAIDRAASGHRRYSPRDIAWVEFLNRLRATGMPIAKMKQYAQLRQQGQSTVSARKALLEEHEYEVRDRLQHLEHNLKAVSEKIALYKEMEHGNRTNKI